MELNNVRIDEQKEAEGVWIEIDDKTEFLIGSSKRPAYRKSLREAIRAELEKTKGRVGELDEEILEQITALCMSKEILLGWKGLTEGGEKVKYSQEKAHELLADTAYRQLTEFVATKAEDISLFRDTSRDEISEELKK